MGTTFSINPALVNLLQNLSNVGSPLLSSPAAMAALQKASPSDIVQLSAEATQLEGLNVILGQPTSDSLLSALYQTGGSAAPTDPLASLEQAPADTSASSTGNGGTALASYKSSLQWEEMQSLFGTDPSFG